MYRICAQKNTEWLWVLENRPSKKKNPWSVSKFLSMVITIIARFLQHSVKVLEHNPGENKGTTTYYIYVPQTHC
jgi:hypothetical protein